MATTEKTRNEERAEYWEHVKSIAAEAIEEQPDDPEGFIRESVDGSAWVIYYSEARKVADFTNNAADLKDALDLSGAEDFDSLYSAAAYLSMEADCLEELRDLQEKAEENDQEDNIEGLQNDRADCNDCAHHRETLCLCDIPDDHHRTCCEAFSMSASDSPDLEDASETCPNFSKEE